MPSPTTTPGHLMLGNCRDDWKDMEMIVFMFLKLPIDLEVEWLTKKAINLFPSYHQKKEYHLLDELNKNCFIKVINQKTIKEPVNSKYDDKILFKVIVYK